MRGVVVEAVAGLGSLAGVATSSGADAVPRTRRRPAELRALILRAAEQVFSAQGYEAATTVEIAERAGVTRGVLWRHFPTKSDLFREAMAVPFLEFVDSWVPRWESQLAQPWPSERLVRTFVAELYRNVRAHRDAVRLLLLGPATGSDELSGASSAIGALLAQVQPIFRQEHESRGYPTTYYELTGRAFLTLILATAVVDPDLFPLEREVSEDEVIDHLALFALTGARLGPAPL